MGGKIIEPANADENTAILNYFSSTIYIYVYWIGLNDLILEGRYVYVPCNSVIVRQLPRQFYAMCLYKVEQLW
jgi:hypothetical protein